MNSSIFININYYSVTLSLNYCKLNQKRWAVHRPTHTTPPAVGKRGGVRVNPV
jgi:hypothetical protein